MSWFRKKEQKANPVGAAFITGGTARLPDRNLKSYVNEGYRKNPIIYSCIKAITQGISTIEIEIHQGDKVIETNPIYDLLARPNPGESGSQFLRHIFTDYLIGGNMYIMQSPDKGKPRELWVADPSKITVKAGEFGLPAYYEYKSGSFTKQFPVDQITGQCQLFHYKTYNPDNPWVGMSPMEPAALSGDAHNEGLRWNYSLLKNGARPSGVIKFKNTPGAETIARLTEFFSKRFAGSGNSGKIPILPNDADWQQIDQTAKDMDFMNGMKEYAKYIAHVYGVPLPIIDNDSASYNNMEQAQLKLWTDTIVPLAEDFLDSFGNWIFKQNGQTGLKFSINKDIIPALDPARGKIFDRMGNAVKNMLITPDEGREALDYTPRGGAANMLYVPSTVVPIDLVGDLPEPADGSVTARV